MSVATAPEAGIWPVEDLEEVGACAACGSTARGVLYEGLTDRLFRCAPGRWAIWRCGDCGSASLDPRPSEQSIVRAYEEYFTHHRDELSEHPGGARAALVNGYLNGRFGTRLDPASALGRVLVPLFPLRRVKVAREVRNLPLPRIGATLLDVGCGDGSFLEAAGRAGWSARGVEIDPHAVDECRESGLDVTLDTIESVDLPRESLDAVTFQHVLEHLHDPRAALVRARELLRPGGLLWLATPNLDSAGHARFGAEWLGLEVPRHLVVFTRRALERLVVDAGFEVVARPTGCHTAWIHGWTVALASRRSRLDPLRTRLSDLRALLQPARGEEQVLLARAA